MRTAFLFHDSFSNPNAEWFPWVKLHLEAQGFFVVAVPFPVGEAQSLESWNKVFEPHRGKIGPESIVIGHGTGAVYVLRLLESLPVAVMGTFLIAPYARPVAHKAIQKASESFTSAPFRWDAIKAKAGMVTVYHGDDDPFIPVAEGMFVAESLGITPNIISQGGHINKASGYGQFLQLIAAVRDVLMRQESVRQASSPEALARHRELAAVLEREESMRIEGLKRKGFRSMHEDMANILKDERGQVVSSVLVETRQAERVQSIKNPLSPKNLAFIVLGVLCVLGGVGVFIWLYYTNAPVRVSSYAGDTQKSLIRSERTHEVPLDALSPASVRDRVQSTVRTVVPTVDTVIEYVPTLAGARIGLHDALSRVAYSASLPISRSMNDRYMWGALRTDRSTTIPFLVMTTDSYDAAFSDLRESEGILAQSLAPFFNLPDDFTSIKRRWVWTSEIIANHNVRILRFEAPPLPALVPPIMPSSTADTLVAQTAASQANVFGATDVAIGSENTNVPPSLTYSYQPGDTVLLYTFLSPRVLLITTHESSIGDMLRRYGDRQLFE